MGCSFSEVVLATGYMDNRATATLNLPHNIVATAALVNAIPASRPEVGFMLIGD
jgi:hypothetical protein